MLDALTNEQFRNAAAMLAEAGGDLKRVARAHPQIDPVYFERNADALFKAAGITPPKAEPQKAEDPKGKK